MNGEESIAGSRDAHDLWALYVSVALVSMSALMLEIGMTRVFSVMFDYHYVFLLISLAILGLGTGGIYVHMRAGKTGLDSHESILPAASGLMALSTVGTVVSIAKVPFLHHPLLVGVVAFFPFFFAGVFVSATFRLYASKSGHLYASDLIGAAAGALLVVVLLRWGGIDTGLFIGFLGALPMGLLAWRKGSKRSRWVISAGLILGLFSIFLGNRLTDFLGEVPLGRGPHKEMAHMLSNPTRMARIIESRWSAFGRTDLIAEGSSADEMALFIDGTAGTTMYGFNGEVESLEERGFADFSEYFPLELLPDEEKEKVLIIGSGGGGQVLVSLLGGAKEITAVEVNKDLVGLVKEYSDFNGGIYSEFPGVKVVVEEGRNFVRRTSDSYDIIMLVIPVTKTSRSPEGFALTENFLFTVESINDYLDLLNPNGRLIVGAHNDLEVFRLIFTSLAALKARGIDTTSAMKHIYTVGPEYFPVFVLKKSPLTPEEAERIHENMHARGYSTHSSFVPHIEQAVQKVSIGQGIYLEQNMLNQSLYLLARGEVSPEELTAAASYEIKAVTDDAPFFYKFDLGIPPVVLLLLAFSAIAVGLGWLIKPGGNGGGNASRKDRRHNYPFLLLFSLLGIGFMLVEIPLIQKFILFLGQPVYATAVLLFSLLVGAGVGSWASDSLWKEHAVPKARFAAIVVCLLVVGYIVSLQRIFTFFLGAPFHARVLVAFGLLVPLGFFMGIPFPEGLKLLEEKGLGPYIPRLWGVNGIGSVLGSALAIALAIGSGFSYALALGAILYFFVFVLFQVELRDLRGGLSLLERAMARQKVSEETSQASRGRSSQGM